MPMRYYAPFPGQSGDPFRAVAPHVLRIGDAERDVAAADLGEHYVAGRLTLDELHERLGAVIFTFVALCALLLLGTLGIFGIGVARPIAIALIIAALGLLRRLIFGRRAGACGSRRR